MRKKWALFIFIFFSASLLFLVKSDPFKGVFGFFLKPFWNFESILSEKIKNFFSSYFFLVEIKRENQKLKEENLKLRQELTYFVEREILYQKLEKLYKIEPPFQYPQVVAKIIYKAVDPFSDQIIINKGSKDGIMPQMPVLALIANEGVGLVGQVVETHKNWSRIILLTDPSFAADVKILRTQDRAILKGKGEKYCSLEFLPLYSEAKTGDTIITSGQDLIYPGGLLVGTLTNLSKDPQGLFKKGEVKPAVDLYNLNWVVILLKIPEISM
ncbi:MAG: rod shape-determining protein MreC [Caldimicrobium sp.]